MRKMTVQPSHTPGGGNAKMQSINPYTEELMGEYALMTKAELDRVVETSRTAFRLWRRVPVEERATQVLRMGDHLREEKRKYAELITREMGKPIREALAEIEKCAWLCDYFAEKAASFLMPEEVETEAKRSYVTFEPLGVVLAIMPWNFPFWQVFRFGIPAICAGNCVLLKHAPSVPATALAIEAAFTAAAFPQGVFQTVLVDPPDALTLLD
jgi:succinate-semialdehyde dehydrogenase / glutarate-semialdehyde dehydrogenase